MLLCKDFKDVKVVINSILFAFFVFPMAQLNITRRNVQFIENIQKTHYFGHRCEVSRFLLLGSTM
jgi:hypothetical protein